MKTHKSALRKKRRLGQFAKLVLLALPLSLIGLYMAADSLGLLPKLIRSDASSGNSADITALLEVANAGYAPLVNCQYYGNCRKFTVAQGTTIKFTSKGFSNGKSLPLNLSLYLSRTDEQCWTNSSCSANQTWTPVPSTTGTSLTSSRKFDTVGSYYVVTNALLPGSNPTAVCTGNPFGKFPGSGFQNCGKDSRVLINVVAPSITAKIDVSGAGNPTSVSCRNYSNCRQYTVNQGTTVSFTARGYDKNTNSRLKLDLYQSPTANMCWSNYKDCPTVVTWSPNSSTTGTSLAASRVFDKVGTYYIVANALLPNSNPPVVCTGNPFLTIPGDGWEDCGSSSRVIINVINPAANPKPTPTPTSLPKK